jgi:predicted amino acid racemase
MTAATLTIDIQKIAANARKIAAMAAVRGVQLLGVTKAVAGMPQVARAMLDGGFAGLGESRLENVRRLRRSGIIEPIMMLRIPPVSDADAVVQLTDISLNSELGTLRALSAAAVRAGRMRDVILMVELGDLREGMSPAELLEASDRAMDCPGCGWWAWAPTCSAPAGSCPRPTRCASCATSPRPSSSATAFG